MGCCGPSGLTPPPPTCSAGERRCHSSATVPDSHRLPRARAHTLGHRQRRPAGLADRCGLDRGGGRSLRRRGPAPRSRTQEASSPREGVGPAYGDRRGAQAPRARRRRPRAEHERRGSTGRAATPRLVPAPSRGGAAATRRSRAARRSASAVGCAACSCTLRAGDHRRSGRRRDRPRRLLRAQLRDDVGGSRAGSRPGRRGSTQCLVRLRSTTSPGSRDVGQRLGSPGTASMNASSTTTRRPGRTQLADRGRPGAGRRSGWSGCRPRPGRRRPGRCAGSSAKPVRGAAHLGRPGGRPGERSVRLGELRVHDDRPAPGPQPGHERERLGGAGRRQHLARADARAARRRRPRPRSATGRRRPRPGSPRRASSSQAGPRPGVHVDGEVEQPAPTSASPWWRSGSAVGGAGPGSRGLGSHATCGSRRGPRRRTAGRAAGGRPSGCGGTTRAGSGRRSRPAAPSTRPGGRRSPRAGSTWVRWNSWPVTARPRGSAGLSVAAVIVG